MAEPSGLTRFEKDYKVVLEKKTGFVEAGLDVAIRGETAGKAAYLALAESASFADISSFFKFLAGEEELHRRMLEELRSSLEKKGGKGAESARSAPGAVEEKRLLETPKSFSKLLGEADELKKSDGNREGVPGILRGHGRQGVERGRQAPLRCPREIRAEAL
ncbi:MAG: hypothetical protein NTY90_05155 [Candidatus Micrarchaeota archaeon]|nr:hypothetical protein [Candidatus Micrarchaeota archaeon]